MTVKYNDKEYGLLWGLGAIEIFCESMNCGLDGLDIAFYPNKDSVKAITNLIFAGLRNYSETKATPLDLTYRQLQDCLSEMPQLEFEEIKTDFLNSKYLGESWLERLNLIVSENDAEKKSLQEPLSTT